MQTKPRYVYVASSWRNPIQPEVCAQLAALDIDHYDFKNPGAGVGGFHWSDVMPSYTRVGPGSPEQLADELEYLEALNHPVALEGFERDWNAMIRADAVVLILPCGRSAHLELGWAVGAGKRTCILLDGPKITPELMYRMVDTITTSTEDLFEWLARPQPESLSEAVYEAFKTTKPAYDAPGVTAGDVLAEMRALWPRLFPMISMLDVHDELTAIMGPAERG